MSEDFKSPYLDSSVFIALVKDEVVEGVKRGQIADHLFALAGKGDILIYTSAITLAEVHKLRKGPRLDEDKEESILAFFEHDYIKLVDVDRKIGEHANRLCRQFSLYPNDAIHLACALRAGCDVLFAWDDRFVRVEQPGIWIGEPTIAQQALDLHE